MFTFFNTWRWGLGCRCLVLVWVNGEGSNWPFIWPPWPFHFGWQLIFPSWNFWSGHGDNKLTSFHPTKFSMDFFSQCRMPFQYGTILMVANDYIFESFLNWFFRTSKYEFFFISSKHQSVCNLVNALIKKLYWKPLLKCFLHIMKFDGFNKIKGDICSGTINAFATGGHGHDSWH
jgi:hypothetical protein